MSPIENYISDAIEIVSCWDLEDETSFADAITAEVRYLANIPSDDYWSGDSDPSIQ